MSIQSVQQFMDKVATDEKLQQELSTIVTGNESDRAAAVQLASKYGYQFTSDELWQEIQKRQNELAQAQQAGELDDAELEAVAGGRGTNSRMSWLSVGAATINAVSNW